MRKLKAYVNDRGIRMAVYDNGPTCGEFGTIYTPPYLVKVDTLRTCAFIWIAVCEELK